MGYKGNYTPQERREFVQKRKEELFDSMTLHGEELIREIQHGNPEKLKAMLDFFSTKASRWSLNNLIALYVQKPYMERPITINEARELGRYPIRGTKLACILAG